MTGVSTSIWEIAYFIMTDYYIKDIIIVLKEFCKQAFRRELQQSLVLAT